MNRRVCLVAASVVFGAAAVAAVLLGPTVALAQGAIAGTSVGVAKQYDYEVGGEIASADDTDTGYRVFGGYFFHPNFGAVLSYVDLGAANYDGPAFDGFTDRLVADGLDLSFLGGWAPGDQSRFSLFGLAGFFRWTQDVHYVDGSGTYDYEDSGTSLSFGVGSEVSLGTAARWGIHFAWQRFLDVGDASNSGHEYDRDLISLGVEYRFGR